MPVTNTECPTVSWSEFLDRFQWRQGQHITLIGPTGCGKTTLTNELIDMRRYSIFLGSKRQDDTQDQLKKMGFMRAKDAAGIHADVSRRWLIRPDFSPHMTADEIKAVNREIFREAMMRAYREGGWTLFIDEGRYITDFLGLKSESVLLLTQGRSQGNSVIMGTQRPRHVPLEAYDQASHLFFWKDPDLQNVQRVAELAGIPKKEVAEIVQSLDWHDFLYVSTRTGETLISRVEV